MTPSLAETIAQARAASDAGIDDRALELAAQALARVDLAADRATDRATNVAADPAAAWALADLLVELGECDAAIALAARLATASPGTGSAVRRAGVLRAADRDAAAVGVLRAAAAAHGAGLEIAGALLELALTGQGWSVLDGLPPLPRAAAALIGEARRRTDGMALDDLDARGVAYALAGVAVLGGSQDDRGRVAPYWFVTVDEYEAAWWLRRLASWLTIEAIHPTAVAAADRAIEPIAIALATRLAVPVASPLTAPAGAIYLHGQLDHLAAATPRPAGITACLAVCEPPTWRALGAISPVDVVGVFAPMAVSWGDPDATGPAPPASVVASRILAELRALPRDRALPAMLRFYLIHRVRARSAGAIA